MKVALLFPPGWTLISGGPHLALPLLASYLRANGVEVDVRDLNLEFANRCGQAPIDSHTANQACIGLELERLNEPYFAAEERLQRVVEPYGGEWNLQTGYSYPNGAAACRKRALRAARERSPYTSFFRDLITSAIADTTPRIVGITIASVQQLIPTLELCARLRESGYDGVIALGGNTVSRLMRELETPEIFTFADVLLGFEGEEALLELCRCVEAERGYQTVPNAVWCEGTEIRRSIAPASKLIASRAPTPDFQGLTVGEYWGENYLPLVALRGCYWGKCSFCAIPFGWGANGFAGARPAHRVVDDMITLIARHGITRFKFVDEALSPGFIRQLSELLIREGLQVEWEAYTRLEPAWLDEDFVRMASAAGFRKGYFGLELLPSRSREALRKGDDVDPETLLRVCSAHGVRVHLFCMYGFPGTTFDEAIQTTDFLIANEGRIDTADVFPWTLAKHTAVHSVEPLTSDDNDWALEFEHAKSGETLSSAEIRSLTQELEELVWISAPRLLHPVYRLVSPWRNRGENETTASSEAVWNLNGRSPSTDNLTDLAMLERSAASDTRHDAPYV